MYLLKNKSVVQNIFICEVDRGLSVTWRAGQIENGKKKKHTHANAHKGGAPLYWALKKEWKIGNLTT